GRAGWSRRGSLYQLPDVARAVRRVPRRAASGRPRERSRFRRDPVLRGMYADRGNGAAGPRHAALRSDEARWTARSTHRQASARRRAVAPGGPRRPDVESRRFSDATAISRTAARVSPDTGSRDRRVSSLRLDSSELLHQFAGGALASPSATRPTARDAPLPVDQRPASHARQ